jgi:hypothetical protein
MYQFLSIELPYIIISVFILGVVLFIGSRDFISPIVLRRGLPGVAIFLVIAVLAHYVVTTSRIIEVTTAFENGNTILCSERRSKMGDRSIEVRKGDVWHIEDGHFVNLENDKFSISQCLVK